MLINSQYRPSVKLPSPNKKPSRNACRRVCTCVRRTSQAASTKICTKGRAHKGRGYGANVRACRQPRTMGTSQACQAGTVACRGSVMRSRQLRCAAVLLDMDPERPLGVSTHYGDVQIMMSQTLTPSWDMA